MNKNRKYTADAKEERTDETASLNEKESRSGKGKGKRQKRDKDAKGIKDSKKKPWNNARWYMPSDAMIKNFSYALEGMLGIPVDLSGTKISKEEIPSIMSISFFNTPGDTSRDIMGFTNPSSAAINVAARVLYTEMSSENKKTTGYQPQDIALAIIAETQLAAALASLTRLYAVALQYNIQNRDIPRMLIAAMGVDPDSFVSASPGTGMSLSDFRDTYNLLAQQANSLPFVGGIKELEKSWAMFANYYCDEPVSMAQLYVPVMEKIAVYKEAVDPDDDDKLVKSMEYHDLFTPDSPKSITSILNTIKNLLDNLNTSSLMNYVYPDLLNFMQNKGAGAFNFPILSDMYVLPPVYDETFLTQVHNMTIIPGITIGDITQDPTRNIIETHITYDVPMPIFAMKQYVDFPYTATPDDELKIDALMFKVGVRETPSTTWPKRVGYQTLPDWVPTRFVVFGNQAKMVSSVTTAHNKDDGSSIDHIFSKFRSAPLMYYFDVSGDSANRPFAYTNGEINTFSKVGYEDLKALFDQAILGLYTYDAEHTLQR